MKRIRGNDYSTVADAAESLGISVATLNRYIRSGFLPPPERIRTSTVSMRVFSRDYIEAARVKIREAAQRRWQGGSEGD